ncbi:endonuclease domain-containing protein [Parvularcula maris]|uniref:DUF559 domain-containing protein n=1 Tax=Parvularcula maris TaxID=2965077 RepID=A0A9X2LAD9_9PROT|nr:DUF559 domain-containing protein [Parvularcula maris]MCQ8186019.1 DUF559 domain-containing protein [Parvularcula maris]
MACKTTNRARNLRNTMPLAEQRLWFHLRRKHLRYRFRRQHPVGPFFLDFACAKLKLAIEVDGDSHFEDEEALLYDHRRTVFLQSEGWTVYRATNREVREEIEAVLSGILSVADEVASNPTR